MPKLSLNLEVRSIVGLDLYSCKEYGEVHSKGRDLFKKHHHR